MALGHRRAEAAKAVIVRDGVEANRIRTISNGFHRPAVLGTGEAVWKWNRNAHTTVIK
jgi:peptidoglycan-associated lipoprotein